MTRVIRETVEKLGIVLHEHHHITARAYQLPRNGSAGSDDFVAAPRPQTTTEPRPTKSLLEKARARIQ